MARMAGAMALTGRSMRGGGGRAGGTGGAVAAGSIEDVGPIAAVGEKEHSRKDAPLKNSKFSDVQKIRGVFRDYAKP